MDRADAINEIEAIFGAYKSLTAHDDSLLKSLNDGKLYELYVLSKLIEDLEARGFRIVFQGTDLEFKAAPGQIKLSDPHFHIHASSGAEFWIFVDIEFETLGSTSVSVADYSGRHELDIVVVSATNPYPRYDEIALGVECKCVGKFKKKLLKEALGVRRELSFARRAQPSILSQAGGTPVSVSAKPPSEFLLAYIDPKGDQYQDSPSAFGIALRHIEP